MVENRLADHFVAKYVYKHSCRLRALYRYKRLTGTIAIAVWASIFLSTKTWLLAFTFDRHCIEFANYRMERISQTFGDFR